MHNRYLSYTEYTTRGGSLPQTEFDIAEFRARKRIDYLTDSRVQNMKTVPESVKLCVFSLIGLDSVVGTEAQVKNPVVTSYSTDGYSENYGKAMGTQEAERSMNALVNSYLFGELDDNGTPLLYRGVRG